MEKRLDQQGALIDKLRGELFAARAAITENRTAFDEAAPRWNQAASLCVAGAPAWNAVAQAYPTHTHDYAYPALTWDTRQCRGIDNSVVICSSITALGSKSQTSGQPLPALSPSLPAPQQP